MLPPSSLTPAHRRRPPCDPVAATPSQGDGAGLPRRQGADAAGRERRRQERDAERATRPDYPRRARTTSRRACARPSARCASACACAARRPILSGSACCVYGLTFTSHFYGARRTVGYVPFNSETLVTGKLFEDIREAVLKLADPGALRRDRHHQPVRADRVAACRCSCCRRRSTACASSASTCRASACRPMPRPRTCWPARCSSTRAPRPSAGPVQAPRAGAVRQADRHAARRDVPGRPGRHRHDAGADGPGRRAGRADARMARALCRARLRGRRGDPSVLHGEHPRVRGGRAADRRLGAGRRTTARRPGCEAIGEACGVARRPDRRGQEPHSARDPRRAREACRSRAASRSRATRAPSCWSARLLIESGADVRYVGTACPRTPWSRGRPRMARGARACTCSSAPRSSRTSRRCASASPTSRSARRRWCRRPRSSASRRSTSPT